MKANNTTVRRFCGITYLSSEQLLSIIQAHDVITNFAFIEHCNDRYTEVDAKNNENICVGDLKIRHIHFILLLKYPYKLSTINNWFSGFVDEHGMAINTFPQKVSSISAYHDYFTHKDDPSKYQYSTDDIIYGDPLDFIKMISLAKTQPLSLST